MLRRLKAILLIGLILIPFITRAEALPPLEDNPRVQNEFLAAAIGDEIRKNCATLSPRYFRVFSRARQLERYALDLGYTRDDIETMRKNPQAKARLRQMRDGYLAAHGVVSDNPDSYCRLGLEEIEKNTLTGWLLRAN